MKLVRTPVPDFTGMVGEVAFVDGLAKVADDATELAYFRTAGYGVEDFDDTVAATDPDVDQAAVDALTDLVEQTGHTDPDPQIVTDVDDDGVEDVLPRRSASTDIWRQFATQHGMSEDEANSLSRDELAARYTPKENDQ